MVRTIELYDMLKSKLGEKESKLLIEAIADIAEKAKTEAATKADLEIEITKVNAKIDKLGMEFRIYFLILLFVIILTNPSALELIGKIFGIAK